MYHTVTFDSYRDLYHSMVSKCIAAALSANKTITKFRIALIVKEYHKYGRVSSIIHHRVKQLFRFGRILWGRYHGLTISPFAILTHQDLSNVHASVTNTSLGSVGVTY